MPYYVHKILQKGLSARTNCFIFRCFKTKTYEYKQKKYNLQSEVFKNVDEFAKFIKSGVSSYTPSSNKNFLASVDLHKEDVKYEALDAQIEFSWLHETWKDVNMIYDSAVKATGASYKWTYRGLISK